VRRSVQQDKTAEPRAVAPIQAQQLRGKLAAAEIMIFLAFLSLQFRSSGWLLSRKTSLFATPLAVQISEAIALAFPEAAPEGSPALWLHRIENEELRQIVADLLLDFRASNLTETGVSDSVERLRRDQANRARARIRTGDLDTAKRQEYLLKLREHKPDTLKKQQDEDSLFG